MNEQTKDEIIDDFVDILSQIDNKSSEEIESSLKNNSEDKTVTTQLVGLFILINISTQNTL